MKTKNLFVLMAAAILIGFCVSQHALAGPCDEPCSYSTVLLDAPGGVGSSEAGPAQTMTDHSSGEGVYWDWPSFEYDGSSNRDLTLSFDFYDLGNWIDNFTSHNWSWGIVEKDPDRKTCYQGSPSSLYPTGAGEQSCFWLHGEDLGGSWEHYEVPISSSKLVDGTNTLYLRAAHAVYGMGSRQVKNVKIGRTLSCCEVIGGLQTDLAACQSAGSACVNCADISTEVLDTICTVLGIAAPTSTPEFIASTTALAQAVLANTTVCPDTTGGADCLAHILDQI